MSSYLENAGYLALLALGFGFVVFWHELGHFLAAKWAGVKVEQFAVGFMQAVVSWRKGLGLRVGSSQKEFRQRIYQHLGRANTDGETSEAVTDREVGEAAQALGLGETEYRLNWLPLGGYVKMLGQDDLRPNSEAEDPRAYNRQTIAKRMVIVSAGVVMNVILAAAGFVVLFMIGFHVPPAKVGSVQPGSPAQLAGLRVGDEILSLDGKPLYNDWTKVQLNAALSASGEAIPVRVRRDGREVELTVTPAKVGGMVGIGVGAIADLAGPPAGADAREVRAIYDDPVARKLYGDDTFALRPGESIVAVNGRAVGVGDFAVLDQAVQGGEPVRLDVRTAGGATEARQFAPSFATPFGGPELSFALLGMAPRMQVESVTAASPARGRLQPGDVVTAVGTGSDAKADPSFAAFRKVLNDAANAKAAVTVTVLRGGKQVVEKDLVPVAVSRESYGLSIGAGTDDQQAVVAETVDGSVAAGRVPARATVTAVDGRRVENWRQVHRALRAAVAGKDGGTTVKVDFRTEGGEARSADLPLSAADVQAVNNVRYAHGLLLQPTIGVRKADNIGHAMSLGFVETRDFILQFYLTLKRMITRDVSPTNLMGPVGIFQAGTHFASKGNDWLIWFLAMISANLAVVNFLPIPIVDGGLFTFLLLEKLKGRPLSARTQAIAQYVGLALLLGIFVFVTWQDIVNFPFRMMR